MEEEEYAFEDGIEDLDFKRLAVLISRLVWKMYFREIGDHLKCSY